MVNAFIDREHHLVSLRNSSEVVGKLIKFLYTNEEQDTEMVSMGKLLETGKITELTSRFLGKLIEKLNADVKNKNAIVTAFSIVFSLMTTLSEVDLLTSVTNLCDKLVGLNESDVGSRIMILKNCHNMLYKTPKIKLISLIAILDIVVSSGGKKASDVLKGLTRVELENTARKWHLDAKDKARLFTKVGVAVLLLKAGNGQSSSTHPIMDVMTKVDFIMLALDNASPDLNAEIEQLAKDVAMLMVRKCFVFAQSIETGFFYLTSTKAFARFQSSSAENKSLFEICIAFSKGHVCTVDSSNLESLGFTSREVGEISENLRVLALGNIGSRSAIISYEEVAKNIDIHPKDVERWIVKAVGQKVIDAKLDQLKRQVIIRSGSKPQGAFTQQPNSTKEVQDALQMWMSSLKSCAAAVPN